MFYSGKKKHHTIKNNLVVGINDRQIKHLGGTHEGKKHDKKIAEEEHVELPTGSDLYQDKSEHRSSLSLASNFIVKLPI